MNTELKKLWDEIPEGDRAQTLTNLRNELSERRLSWLAVRNSQDGALFAERCNFYSAYFAHLAANVGPPVDDVNVSYDLNAAVEYAAEKLPINYSIEIYIERDAGCAILMDDVGDETALADGEISIAQQVMEGVKIAQERES